MVAPTTATRARELIRGSPTRVLPGQGSPEAEILDVELKAMMEKDAGHQAEHSADSVISGYFARPKKSAGKYRPIVSLKYSNRFIRKIPFRMTTVAQIKAWISPGCYFVSLDLRDAYFRIPYSWWCQTSGGRSGGR